MEDRKQVFDHALQTIANPGDALLDKLYNLFGQISGLYFKRLGGPDPPFPLLGTPLDMRDNTVDTVDNGNEIGSK